MSRNPHAPHLTANTTSDARSALKSTKPLLAPLVASCLALGSTTVHADDLTLSSDTIRQNGTLGSAQVFAGFGCDGENISPDLQWTPGPDGTKSYAVTVYDPDAPTGSGWWHWIVYNIPADVTSLPTNAGLEGGANLPEGAVHGRSDFGTYGFGGACPPLGDNPHRYEFVVHALQTDNIDLPTDASAALIGYMVTANRLSSSKITARFGR